MKYFNRIRLYSQSRFTSRARNAKRRASQLGVEGRFTSFSIKNLYVKQRGKCACCGEVLNGRFEVDHIIPLSKGGSNFPNNLQLLTPKCNKAKGAKMEVLSNGK